MRRDLVREAALLALILVGVIVAWIFGGCTGANSAISDEIDVSQAVKVKTGCSLGTGGIIDSTTVSTAGHVVLRTVQRCGDDIDGWTVIDVGGREYRVVDYWMSPGYDGVRGKDYAELMIDPPFEVSLTRMSASDRVPSPDEWVCWIAYKRGPEVYCGSAYMSFLGYSYVYGHVEHGFSGGPIFTSDGWYGTVIKGVTGGWLIAVTHDF
jgi:hypothetical protein